MNNVHTRVYMYVFVYLPVHLSLSVCLSVCLPVLPVLPSIHPSVCLSVCLCMCIQQDDLLWCTFLQDNNGRYPIHWVTNNSDTQCTQLLIDKVTHSHAVYTQYIHGWSQVVGLDVNVRDSSMMTPLMWAAFHARPEQIKVLKENGAGQYTVVMRSYPSLLNTPLDPSLADIDGMCAIHWAIHRHETGTLKV